MGSVRRAGQSRGALVAVGALVAGCASPTQLMIVLDTDLAQGPGQALQSVELTVRSASDPGMPVLWSTNGVVTVGPDARARLSLPARVLNLVPRGGDASRRVLLEAVGHSGVLASDPVVCRTAGEAGFVAGQARQVVLFLSSECQRLACPDAQYCVTDGAGAHCSPTPSQLATTPYDPNGALPRSDASLDALPDSAPDSARPDAPAPPDAGFDSALDVGTDAVAADATDAQDAVTTPDAGYDVVQDSPVDVPALDVACPMGQVRCAGACVSLVNDRNNCGGCGNSCATLAGAGASTCADSACVLACDANRGNCDAIPGNGCEADLTQPAHCGSCGNRCLAPTGGSATCMAGVCGAACGSGLALVSGACVAPMPPRPLSPMSTSTVTTSRPTLRWDPSAAPGTDGAYVEFCADRACARVLGGRSFSATGSSGAPTTALMQGVVYWRLHGTIGGVMGTATGPVWEFRVPGRNAPSVDSSNGTELDVNGDGYSDLAVAAPQGNGGAGSVYLYLGSAMGLGASPALTLTPPAGATASAGFGSGLASAGDVNGDGYGDLVVGAPGANSNLGAAYLYLGSAMGLSTMPMALSGPIAAMGANSAFGTSVAGLGDVNNDGYGDVLVGASGATGGGRAFLYFGSSSGTGTHVVLSAPAGSSFYGSGVVGPGDVNGDGRADMVVAGFTGGIPGTLQVYSYLGSPTVHLTPDATFTQSGIGGRVVSGNDFNGDGYGDYATVQLGTIALVFGRAGTPDSVATPLVLPATGESPTTGRSVGDVDGDGFADFAVETANFSSATVHLVLVHGRASGVTDPSPQILSGPITSTGVTFWDLGYGDLDGDGLSDFAVAVSAPVSGPAMVFLYQGRASGGVAPWVPTLTSPTTGDYFGEFLTP